MGEGVTIDPDTLRSRIEAVCRELGLDRAICARLLDAALGAGGSPSLRGGSGGSGGSGGRDRLRAAIEKARADKDRLASLKAEVRRRLGTPSHDSREIVHALRNVLNNLVLLQQGESR